VKTGRVLGVVVLILLLVIITLWGLLTYGLGYLPPLPVAESSGTRATWSALVVVVVGLLAGWISGRCLVRGRRPPGSMWVALAAGVGGAWLGGVLLGPGYWRWLDINVVGLIVVSFALAVGVEGIVVYWYGRKGRR